MNAGNPQNTSEGLAGRHVAVGVSGGIAAYKAVDLCSRLRKAGAEVRVAMTEAATRFVSPLTFEAIVNSPVSADLFERSRAWEMDHIADARWADLLVIAPATANIIAKMAAGMADDTVSALALSFEGPVLVAPAMNRSMYQHPATVKNLEALRERGIQIVEPGSGRLACGEVGPGRLEEPENILEAIVRRLGAGNRLMGKKVVVTAGPTREFIDPARFLSNPSSGRMGFALAAEARTRGADVVLITGPTELAPPSGVIVERIVTTAELLAAVQKHFSKCDLAIFAAAPADYRVEAPSEQKQAKGESLELRLKPTEDVAAWCGQNRRDNQLLVAFAAETHDGDVRALEKLKRKNCDFIVLNDISRGDIGFGSRENEVVILSKTGERKEIGKATKEKVAARILDCLQ